MPCFTTLYRRNVVRLSSSPTTRLLVQILRDSFLLIFKTFIWVSLRTRESMGCERSPFCIVSPRAWLQSLLGSSAHGLQESRRMCWRQPRNRPTGYVTWLKRRLSEAGKHLYNRPKSGFLWID